MCPARGHGDNDPALLSAHIPVGKGPLLLCPWEWLHWGRACEGHMGLGWGGVGMVKMKETT